MKVIRGSAFGTATDMEGFETATGSSGGIVLQLVIICCNTVFLPRGSGMNRLVAEMMGEMCLLRTPRYLN